MFFVRLSKFGAPGPSLAFEKPLKIIGFLSISWIFNEFLDLAIFFLFEQPGLPDHRKMLKVLVFQWKNIKNH